MYGEIEKKRIEIINGFLAKVKAESSPEFYKEVENAFLEKAGDERKVKEKFVVAFDGHLGDLIRFRDKFCFLLIRCRNNFLIVFISFFFIFGFLLAIFYSSFINFLMVS